MRSFQRPTLPAPLRFGLPTTVALLLLTSMPLLSSCQNSCQQICSRMARYAEDCGIEVPKDELQACRDAQAGAESKDDRSACREFGGAKEIQEFSDCEEVASYWQTSTADPGTDGTTDE